MEWRKIVGAVAPTLATALGGPLAGMAVSAVSDALLGKPNGSEGEIAAALQAGGGEALARLREAVLAGLIVGGFLLMVWFVLAGHVGGLKDPVAAGLIGTLIGYVSAKADQVVSYYFGSSAGSAAKTELLRKP